MNPISIIDVIDHRNKYAIQSMVVVDRMPKFLYEKRGGWLIGHDSGFFKFYAYESVQSDWPSNWKAWGGREFDIPLTDGGVVKAFGQWWDSFPKGFQGLTYDYGVNTPTKLERCNVFTGGIHIDCELVDAWRAEHEPSNNYHKFDSRDDTFGQHRIVSQWETEHAGSAF